jgi:glucose/arabinose dehydrogenase
MMDGTPVNVTVKAVIVGSMALFLAACGDSAKLPEEAAFGPNPKLPEPTETIIPTINIARAKGWPQGASPTPSAGLSVQAFTAGLDHPRWLYVLPKTSSREGTQDPTWAFASREHSNAQHEA